MSRYDACKLVPRPKWKARRPPEQAYTSSQYDIYMFVFVYFLLILARASRFASPIGFEYGDFRRNAFCRSHRGFIKNT